MKSTSSKENILKKIRQALTNPVPVPFPKSEGSTSVFQPQSDDLEIEFANEFTKLLGKFAFCLTPLQLHFRNVLLCLLTCISFEKKKILKRKYTHFRKV